MAVENLVSPAHSVLFDDLEFGHEEMLTVTQVLNNAMESSARLIGRLRMRTKLILLVAIASVCAFAGVFAGPNLEGSRWVLLLGLAIMFSYAAVLLYSVSRALTNVQRMLDAACAGDLTQSSKVAGQDELSKIGVSVEMLVAQMSRIVARVRSESQLIGFAGHKMTSGARDLSDRTETQASNLEQTSASLSELVGNTTRSASVAQAVTELAQRVREQAEGGVVVVDQSVQAMQRIESRSKKMSEIIAVIDGIAFQTNILALNAAVEAARAGDSGRGFAVVAGEVRSLAQRSAKAASEVKALIDHSNTEVGQGVAAIGQVSQSLSSVVGGVREVAQRMHELSASNVDQSNSLKEISQAVNQLDQITQQNAQMVDVSVGAAERLQAQSEVLAAAVGKMRLRQGCADEARSLVERATALLNAQGLEAAKEKFHDRSGEFFDRDLFVFVIDRKNYFRAFGADPTKSDKPSVAAPGTDIQDLCARVWRAVSEQGGWVEYRSMHPITKLIVDKIGYVLPSGDAKYAVMCGVNRSDGTQASSASDEPKVASTPRAPAGAVALMA